MKYLKMEVVPCLGAMSHLPISEGHDTSVQTHSMRSWNYLLDTESSAFTTHAYREK